ncbi:MAG: hypothetical protein B7Z68_00020 [Acidobacteria bacterium 21-70-11]|nr:MAG: hypothetical protein B7Z68_00020 [Acidobacteria bacterium 21-70-11]
MYSSDFRTMTLMSKNWKRTIAYANVSGISVSGTSPQNRNRSVRNSDGSTTPSTRNGVTPATVPTKTVAIWRRSRPSSARSSEPSSASSPSTR